MEEFGFGKNEAVLGTISATAGFFIAGGLTGGGLGLAALFGLAGTAAADTVMPAIGLDLEG